MPDVPVIDAHVHLWEPTRFAMAWLDGDETIGKLFWPRRLSRPIARGFPLRRTSTSRWTYRHTTHCSKRSGRQSGRRKTRASPLSSRTRRSNTARECGPISTPSSRCRRSSKECVVSFRANPDVQISLAPGVRARGATALRIRPLVRPLHLPPATPRNHRPRAAVSAGGFRARPHRQAEYRRGTSSTRGVRRSANSRSFRMSRAR